MKRFPAVSSSACPFHQSFPCETPSCLDLHCEHRKLLYQLPEVWRCLKAIIVCDSLRSIALLCLGVDFFELHFVSALHHYYHYHYSDNHYHIATRVNTRPAKELKCKCTADRAEHSICIMHLLTIKIRSSSHSLFVPCPRERGRQVRAYQEVALSFGHDPEMWPVCPIHPVWGSAVGSVDRCELEGGDVHGRSAYVLDTIYLSPYQT
jgi:hypothetical protein